MVCAGVMVGHFFIHTEQGPLSLFLRNRRSTRTPGGPAAAAIGKAKLEGALIFIGTRSRLLLKKAQNHGVNPQMYSRPCRHVKICKLVMR
jgi:hypothetical protein